MTKVPEDVVDRAVKFKNKFGLKKIPTVDEADELFNSAVRSRPDARIPASGLADDIQRIGAGSGNKTIQNGLKEVSDDIRRAFNLTDQIEGRPHTLSVDEFVNIRTKLNRLRKGAPELTRFIDEAKTLVDDAASTVIKDFEEAKSVFQMSREMEKVVDLISDPNFDETVFNMLNRAGDAGRIPSRERLIRMIGEGKGAEILDLLDAHKLLQDPTALGKLRGEGLFSIIRGGVKRGIRRAEERRAPSSPSQPNR